MSRVVRVHLCYAEQYSFGHMAHGSFIHSPVLPPDPERFQCRWREGRIGILASLPVQTVTLFVLFVALGVAWRNRRAAKMPWVGLCTNPSPISPPAG